MNVFPSFAAVRAVRTFRRVFLAGLACLGMVAAMPSHAQTLQKIKQSGELRVINPAFCRDIDPCIVLPKSPDTNYSR